MTSIVEIKSDIQEVESLLASSRRPRIKAILDRELASLRASLATIQIEKSVESTDVPASGKRYKELKTFAWDGESPKFVKIYVNLKGIGAHSSSSIFPNFTSRSCEVKIDGFNSANYVFSLSNLLSEIVPEDSSFKTKTDEIILTLKKKDSKTWGFITEADKLIADRKKKKESDESAGTDNSNPEAGIMNMMKKMYDEGDDDMKRTIGKAWTESRNKPTPGMDDI
jgi:calcyclin binding protein